MRISNRPISRQNAARILDRIKRDFDALLIFAPTDAFKNSVEKQFIQEHAVRSVQEALEDFYFIYGERSKDAVPNRNREVGEMSLNGPGASSNARLFSAGSGGK